MIGKRLSEPRWVCSIQDGALLGVDDELMRQYGLTREISLLPIDLETGRLKTSGEPVTLVQVVPLLVDYEYLLGGVTAESGTRWEVFRRHVRAVKNLEGVQTSNNAILDSCRSQIDLAFVAEISGVIIEQAMGKNGSDRPFSLPVTWLGDRMRARSLPAQFARLVGASDQKDAGAPQENQTQN